ncbi:hypothetical protein H2200_009276 [Cladophialophora chaetospira]|uniref:Xylanolytic transcriptional activator regulatory domain-containing protein n=1 Tax=Cladophialophora chaetospira TaxID=386627 RepID=A0AA38X3X0_9EURO|nr:hypothetical protein H2200_009276 [Cladophialophora chaetospira]
MGFSARREIVQSLRTNVPGATLSPNPVPAFQAANEPSPVLETTTAGACSPASTSDSGHYVSSKLRPSPKLGFLLKYCFDELEIYYPCIDRADFYGRLSVLFVHDCSYGDGRTLIPKKPESLALAALTCTIVALATYLVGRSQSEDSADDEDTCGTDAWEWHLESRRLLTEHAWQNDPCLDVLRLHLLEVLFFTMVEQSQALSMAKAVAVELAFALELNNEAAWSKTTQREKEYRRLLWWMVYIIDRRISIRVGRPYLIQDSDCAVGEFTSLSRLYYLSNDTFEYGCNPADIDFGMNLWPRPSKPAEDWFAYLHFNVCWSRIAARAWDSCCSLRARQAVDLDEVNAVDQLLRNLERSLPPTLLWSPNGLASMVQAGNSDRFLRLRLIIFERINTLRLFIRSSPRTSTIPLLDWETAQTTETIASDTIDSAVGYLSLRNEARPWCTYLTLLLIDISSRIAPIVMRQAKNPTVPAYRVILSMVQAQDCLRNLGKSKLRITHKALARLKEISDDVNLAFETATSIPRLISIGHASFWPDGKPCKARIDSAQDVMPLDDWTLDMSEIWDADDLIELFSSQNFPLDF